VDKDISWLEVSISSDGELAEAISEVLARYVTQGVVIETGVKYDETEEFAQAYGPVKVYGYLEYDESVETKKRQIEEALWHLSMIQPIPKPRFKKIENHNWMESWREFYKSILIGRKLLILPAWLENPNPERLAIMIDPSMAFGTGTHPTTQICLALAEKAIQPNDNVIDVGCGSGILSIAAVKLGAKKVIAVDIDEESIKATKKNGQANKVLESIETGLGSVPEILNGNFTEKNAPVVLVNILAPIIIRLFGEGLSDLVQEKGTLILSGILDHQAKDVKDAAELHGFRLIEEQFVNDWVGMIFSKNI
jgi:ribosomal protein L11 methyltransferase